MSENTHLLIVDDDHEIRHLLAKQLREYGFTVSTAKDGVEMFQQLDKKSVDLVILDLMMPGEDGLSLCRKIRQTSHLPIVMLTAIGEDTDRIVGLEMGADDYVTKPFNPRELLARVKAVLRRSPHQNDPLPGAESNCASFAGWTLNLNTRSLTSEDNVEITLSSGEYNLLIAFVEHPQKVLSRDQLLDITKNRMAGPFDRAIDVQISRLRRKLEPDPKNPVLIKTVRGGGYLFTPQLSKTT